MGLGQQAMLKLLLRHGVGDAAFTNLLRIPLR